MDEAGNAVDQTSSRKWESGATPFFTMVIARHIEEYIRHFADRLTAIYVWGSVHRNEAVPGVSDLDLHVFIANPLVPADEEWFQRERHTLEAQFPGTMGLSRPFPLSRLLDGLRAEAGITERRLSQALGFRLRHDATLLWGKDLVQDLKELPPFDKEFGVEGFESQRDLARWLAGWERENKTDFSLPVASCLRLRKLARLAVLGGAWYRIATGRSFSLCGSDVLPALRGEFPDWTAFLRQTDHLYIVPITDTTASMQLESYTVDVARWVDMLGERLGIGPTIEPLATT